MPLAKSHRYPKTGNGREAFFCSFCWLGIHWVLLVAWMQMIFLTKLQWKQDKVLGMWQREVKEVDGECRVYVYDLLE